MSAPKTITHLLPTGAIILWGGADMPNGFLLCNGASVSRSDYPDLAEALGETGTTFSLPDYRDRVPQGAGTVSPNVGVEASLPAIEGTSDVRSCYAPDYDDGMRVIAMYPTGAFAAQGSAGEIQYNSIPCYAIEMESERVTFDASRHDSVYSGTTVQPSALTAHFLIKA